MFDAMISNKHIPAHYSASPFTMLTSSGNVLPGMGGPCNLCRTTEAFKAIYLRKAGQGVVHPTIGEPKKDLK